MRYLISLLFCLCLSIQAAPFGPAHVASWSPSLLNGLVAYWPLDEASGTRYDVWGTNHLTDQNTVGYVGGKIGNCTTNIKSNFEILYSKTFNLNTNFTVSSWVFGVDQYSASSFGCPSVTLDSVSSSTNRSFQFGLKGGFIPYFSVCNSNGWFFGIIADASSYSYSNVWIHLVGTLDASTMSLYTNGVLVSSVNVAGNTVGTNYHTITVSGGIYGHGAVWSGCTDEAAMWNRALTADEIKLLYNIGRGRRFPFNSGP